MGWIYGLMMGYAKFWGGILIEEKGDLLMRLILLSGGSGKRLWATKSSSETWSLTEYVGR